MGRRNNKDDTAHEGISKQRAETAAGYALPGTFLERNASCNKAGCRCMADPPRLHGPYYQWTRKIDGKTKTTRLTVEQVERYRPWFDNAKTIRALTAELEALSLDIASTTEDWN